MSLRQLDHRGPSHPASQKIEISFDTTFRHVEDEDQMPGMFLRREVWVIIHASTYSKMRCKGIVSEVTSSFLQTGASAAHRMVQSVSAAAQILGKYCAH